VGLIDITERLDIPEDVLGRGGQWVDVRLLSIDDYIQLNREVNGDRSLADVAAGAAATKAAVKVAADAIEAAGEDTEDAERAAMEAAIQAALSSADEILNTAKFTCRRAIVAWSDDAEPTAENIDKLPHEAATWISNHVLRDRNKATEAEAIPPTSESSTELSTETETPPSGG
jgi:uncharacterized membrane protein